MKWAICNKYILQINIIKELTLICIIHRSLTGFDLNLFFCSDYYWLWLLNIECILWIMQRSQCFRLQGKPEFGFSVKLGKASKKSKNVTDRSANGMGGGSPHLNIFLEKRKKMQNVLKRRKIFLIKFAKYVHLDLCYVLGYSRSFDAYQKTYFWLTSAGGGVRTLRTGP